MTSLSPRCQVPHMQHISILLTQTFATHPLAWCIKVLLQFLGSGTRAQHLLAVAWFSSMASACPQNSTREKDTKRVHGHAWVPPTCLLCALLPTVHRLALPLISREAAGRRLSPRRPYAHHGKALPTHPTSPQAAGRESLDTLYGTALAMGPNTNCSMTS